LCEINDGIIRLLQQRDIFAVIQFEGTEKDEIKIEYLFVVFFSRKQEIKNKNNSS
jgi:hypothetical protein